MGMTMATEGLQFSLLDVDFYCPISWWWETERKHLLACKIELSKGRTVFKDRNRDEIQKGHRNVLHFSLDCESVLIMYRFQKLNALGTMHLPRFLSVDTNPPTPHPPPSKLLYYPSFTAPPLHTVLSFLNQTIDNPSTSVLVSLPVCLCLSIWLFLRSPGGEGGGQW